MSRHPHARGASLIARTPARPDSRLLPLLALFALTQVAWGDEPTKTARSGRGHVEVGFPAAADGVTHFEPRSIALDRFPTLRVTTNGRTSEYIDPRSAGGGSVAGAECGPVTYADPGLFEGGRFSVQAGFAQGEVAYAVYDVDPSLFPITIESMECVFAQTTSNRTVTHWSVLIWDGPPVLGVGLQVGVFSSDGTILPHVTLPAPNGAKGVNLRVSVDPGDPQPIQIFNDSRTNKFSIGFRIDQHNNPPASPCTESPDPNTNAFPTTDVDRFCVGGVNDGKLCDPHVDCPGGSCLFGLCFGGSSHLLNCSENRQCFGGTCAPDVNLTGNWLSAQTCGGSCDGTNPFANLQPFLCRPTGDWVIRATFSCTFIGACCDVNAVCGDGVPNTLCTEQRGTFMGDGSVCGQVPCPTPVGACCLSGVCLDDAAQVVCDGLSGGVYMGNGSVCSGTLCQRGACCMPDGSCAYQLDAQCASTGGAFHGGTTCASFSCPQPKGACCIQTSCVADQAKNTCEAVGTWMGTDSTCVPDPCAPPGCPNTPILAVSPPSETIDARQPHGVEASTPRQGIGAADEPIVLTLGVTGAEGCFELCETGPDLLLGDNGIASVTDLGGGQYRIVLNRAITPGVVTTILNTGHGSFAEYPSHPGNVNVDTVTDDSDLIFLAKVLRGVEAAPFGDYSADVDHSGLTTPADLLREVDLLLGGGALDEWLGTDLPIRDICP